MGALRMWLYQLFTVVLSLSLVAQFALPLWEINIQLPRKLIEKAFGDVEPSGNAFWYRPSVSRSRQARAIVTIVALSTLNILLSFWLPAILYCVWSSRWLARRFPLVSAPLREVNQVPEGSRERKYCEICKIFQDDRMHHVRGHGIDRCVPEFDHYCPWWHGVVWKHNLKAYIVFLALLPAHQLFCLVVSSWELAQNVFPSGTVAVLLADGTIVYSLFLLGNFLYTRVFLNLLASEECRMFTMGLTDFWITTAQYEGFACFGGSDNPFNRGYKKNLDDLMGPMKHWLLFWKPTPAMEYDAPQHRIMIRPSGASLVPIVNGRLSFEEPEPVELVELETVTTLPWSSAVDRRGLARTEPDGQPPAVSEPRRRHTRY